MPENNGAPGDGGNPGESGNETKFTVKEFNEGKWRDSLSEENATHGSLANFSNFDDVINSYRSAQKMVSSDKIAMPAGDDDVEGWNNVFDKLGRPSEADLYDLHLPEGSPDTWSNDNYKTYKKDFKKMAHESGMSAKQTTAAWNHVLKGELSKYNNFVDTNKSHMDKLIADTKNEFGSALLDKINKRDAALNALGGQESVDFVKNNPALNSNPGLIKIFNKVADMMGEDKINDATINKGGTTPAEAQSKLNAILADSNSSYRDTKHPDHAAGITEFMKLVELSKKGK